MYKILNTSFLELPLILFYKGLFLLLLKVSDYNKGYNFPMNYFSFCKPTMSFKQDLRTHTKRSVSISYSVKLRCQTFLFGLELNKNRISRDYTQSFLGCALYSTSWKN